MAKQNPIVPPIGPDDFSRIVTLTYGTMDHGGPYWCYVAVKPSRYAQFQEAMNSKRYNMQQFDQDGYGEVIVSGAGVVPPKQITRQVADMFNVQIKDLFAVSDDPMPEINEQIKKLNGDEATN